MFKDFSKSFDSLQKEKNRICQFSFTIQRGGKCTLDMPRCTLIITLHSDFQHSVKRLWAEHGLHLIYFLPSFSSTGLRSIHIVMLKQGPCIMRSRLQLQGCTQLVPRTSSTILTCHTSLVLAQGCHKCVLKTSATPGKEWKSVQLWPSCTTEDLPILISVRTALFLSRHPLVSLKLLVLVPN